MAERIQINDGSKTYELVNQAGEVLGTIKINPSDTAILGKINEISEALDAVNMKDLGEGAEAVINAEKILREKFAELFGAANADTVFGITGPLSPLDSGEFYIENVLNAVVPIYEKIMSARQKKMQKHMDKYVAQYTDKE